MNKTLRVLMLEDNACDAELILANLAQEGIRCEARRLDTQSDFMAALHEEQFDLILSDCSLPSFDGLSALHIARSVTPATPFIFVSGTIGEELAIESLKTGATDYVLKHKLSRLVPAVRRAITEAEERAARVEADKARSQAESLLRALFDQTAVGVLITRVDGRIVRTNRAARAMFGYDETEFNGLPLARLFALADSGQQDCYEELRTGTMADCEIEAPYLRKDGTRIWGRTVVSAIRDEGSLEFIVHLVQDITERKKMEERFLESQKMEAVGRLAAGIAHDFNNVLTIINGYTDLVLEQLPPSHPARRELKEVRGAGDRAAKLTQRLLSFSRQQPTQSVPVDLNAIVEGLTDVLQHIAGEQVRVLIDLDSEAGPVNADPTQIEQVVLNLAINARDAMPNGGEIRILTKSVEVEAGVAGASLASGKYVALTVMDTGQGMDDAVKGRIFEPFFTTKEVGKGTGLGLWMVSEITRRAGGTITVDSKPGQGTAFHIHLPQIANPVRPMLTPATVQRPVVKGETILIAEDDDAVGDLLRQVLTLAGYKVLSARNGAEALAIVDCDENYIDLLVTDIGMPGISGSELAVRVIARRPDVRVLCVSGHSDCPEAAEEGSKDWTFLRKPFTTEQLLSGVRRTLDMCDKRTILVVDDDQSVRMVLTDILRRWGHLTFEACDGRQAVRQLRQQPIDLMITDLVMPDQEGLETICAVRREFPQLKVIAMSGGFGEQYFTAAKRLGAHDTLLKPFDQNSLCQMIARLLTPDSST